MKIGPLPQRLSSFFIFNFVLLSHIKLERWRLGFLRETGPACDSSLFYVFLFLCHFTPPWSYLDVDAFSKTWLWDSWIIFIYGFVREDISKEVFGLICGRS